MQVFRFGVFVNQGDKFADDWPSHLLLSSSSRDHAQPAKPSVPIQPRGSNIPDGKADERFNLNKRREDGARGGHRPPHLLDFIPNLDLIDFTFLIRRHLIHFNRRPFLVGIGDGSSTGGLGGGSGKGVEELWLSQSEKELWVRDWVAQDLVGDADVAEGGARFHNLSFALEDDWTANDVPFLETSLKTLTALLEAVRHRRPKRHKPRFGAASTLKVAASAQQVSEKEKDKEREQEKEVGEKEMDLDVGETEEEEEEGRRPVFFFCYGLAGFCLKQMLICAHLGTDPAHVRLLQRVRGVAFFCVPHRGNSPQMMASILKDITAAEIPHPDEGQMTKLAGDVMCVNRAFDKLLTVHPKLSVLTFAPFPIPRLIPEEYAWPSRGTLEWVHRRELLTRPLTREDAIYLRCVHFLRKRREWKVGVRGSVSPSSSSTKAPEELCYSVWLQQRTLYLYKGNQPTPPGPSSANSKPTSLSKSRSSANSSLLFHESYTSLFTSLDRALRQLSVLLPPKDDESHLGNLSRLVSRFKQAGLASTQGSAPLLRLFGEKREIDVAAAFVAYSLGLDKSAVGSSIVVSPQDNWVCTYEAGCKAVGGSSTPAVTNPPHGASATAAVVPSFGDHLQHLLHRIKRLKPPAPASQETVPNEQSTSGNLGASGNIGKDLAMDPELIQQLEDAVTRPLRIAIVGRSNAGKSTLINAMLGRTLLPTHGDICTAAVLEIVACKNRNEERMEFHYIDKSAFAERVNLVQQSIDEMTADLEVLKSQKHMTGSQHAISEIEQQAIRKNKYLMELVDTYSNLPRDVDGNLLPVTIPKPTEAVLKASTTTTSGVKADLIDRARLHVRCKLLTKVAGGLTLVDTPGYGAQNVFHNSSALKAIRQADAWVYLTPRHSMDDVSREVSLFNAHANNAPGLLVITHFDHNPDGPLLDELVREKQSQLKLLTPGSATPPAVAMRIVSQASSSPKRGTTEEKKAWLSLIQDQLRLLVSLHAHRICDDALKEIVQQQSVPQAKAAEPDPFGENDSSSGSESEDEDDSTFLSAAAETQTVPKLQFTDYAPVKGLLKFLKDAGKEAGQFVPFMDSLYMLTQSILRQDIARCLYEISTVTGHLMHEVTRQIDLIKYEASCGGSIEQLKLLLQKQVEQLNKVNEQWEKGQKAMSMIMGDQEMREVSLREQVLQTGLENITTRRAELEKMVKAKTTLRLAAQFDISIFQEFDRYLNIYAKRLFDRQARPSKELPSPFEKLQRSVSLEVDIRTRNFTCFSPGVGRLGVQGGTELIDIAVKYYESILTSAKKAKALFITAAERAARDHAEKMASNAQQQLSMLHAMIRFQLSAELDRLKMEREKEARNVAEREMKLQMTRADMGTPAFVLNEQLMGLKTRYDGLLSFSCVLFECLVHCVMRDQFSARTMLVKDASRQDLASPNMRAPELTPVEEEYLMSVYYMFEQVRTGGTPTTGVLLFPQRLETMPSEVLLKNLNASVEKQRREERFIDRKEDLARGEEDAAERGNVFLVVERQKMYVVRAGDKQKWVVVHTNGRTNNKDSLRKLARNSKVRMILAVAIPSARPRQAEE